MGCVVNTTMCDSSMHISDGATEFEHCAIFRDIWEEQFWRNLCADL